ncbi:MAG: efflux RND transporter periplasmic adaptor subunit [Deltaproteobacteria bacterium]|nr:efflux RND transporter periplasmic adaptor subunit [Deltaproteobacteria bacterium]
MRRRWKIAVWALALAAAGGLAAWLVTGREGKPAAPEWDTATVERGRVVARVSATGTISPTVTVQVGTQVSGRVQQLLADFNHVVRKGDVIARIDPAAFQAAREQAEANLAAARANVARVEAQARNLKRQAERLRSLVAQKFASDADADAAEAAADAARAEVGAARAAVGQASAALRHAEVNLAYTTIPSPIDGTVISRNVDVGQTVAASLQAPTLFTIAEDLRKMQVHSSVSEADVGKLDAGMAATFTVDAWPSERFRGVIREVRNSPQTVQNVVTYDAVIDVENPDLKLRPGMTANVTIRHADREGVLKVPNAALRFRPPPQLAARAPGNPEQDPDRRTVWVLRGDAPEAVRVRPGVTDGTVTEVVDGDLREGDRVVIDAANGGDRKAGPPGMGGGMGTFRRVF